MIRNLVKRAARRALRRPSAAPHAPPAAVPRPAAPPEPSEPQVDPEVEGDELRKWVDAGEVVHFLDIREPRELLSGHADGAVLVPMNQVPHRLAELPRDGRLVVYCAAGARSYGVAHYLREHGFSEAWSLAGGLGAWAQVGGTLVRPPSGARFPLTSRVRITRSPLEIDGVVVPDTHTTGTVQAIRQTDDGLRYTIGLLDEGGAPFAIHDVTEAELAR